MGLMRISRDGLGNANGDVFAFRGMGDRLAAAGPLVAAPLRAAEDCAGAYLLPTSCASFFSTCARG
jgi:hypothetical protein